MCIIHAFPKGTEKLNEKTKKFIKVGFDCNKDGSGYMFKRHGEKKITINKGFFNIDLLIIAIEREKLTNNDELVVHHRICTAGLVTPANCHPFVISKNHSETAATSITTDKLCLAHNGHFSKLSSYQDLDRDFSDTYAFSRYILADANLQSIMIGNPDLFKTLLDDIISYSKIAIMYPEKDKAMSLYGNFVQDEGYFHSNHNYCKIDYTPRSNSFTHKSHNAKDWDEGYKGGTEDAEEYYAALIENRNAVNNRQKALNEATSGKVSIIKLDGTLIKITNKNCKHFHFVEKNKFDKSILERKFELGRMDAYYPNQPFQGIVYNSDYAEYMVSDAVKNSELTKAYWYIPVSDHLETYKGYLDLFKRIPDPGKQTLKKLKHILEKYVACQNDRHIPYNRFPGEFFRKSSLLAYEATLEQMLEAEDKWQQENVVEINSKEDALNNKLQKDIAEALEAAEKNNGEPIHSLVDHLEINT